VPAIEVLLITIYDFVHLQFYPYLWFSLVLYILIYCLGTLTLNLVSAD